MKNLLALYSPRFATRIIYMLQSTEYQPAAYVRWFWTSKNLASVMIRRELDKTKAARLLLLVLRLGILLQLLVAIFVISIGMRDQSLEKVWLGLVLAALYPLLWAHLILLPLLLGRWFVAGPKERRMVAASLKIFRDHQGVKIAIAGSYGKTSMKELLTTILSEGLNVAATPANKNVSVSHALFAQRLSGNEDVLLIEYGEGRPGDVTRFATATHPTHAVITGLAPAHLDAYKTLDAAARDIFSLQDFVPPEKLFVNDEAATIQPYLGKAQVFNRKHALGWKIQHTKTSITGTDFVMTKGTDHLKLSSQLVGEHQVAALAFAIALGLELGLTQDQAVRGVSKTHPFEHRMQPYPLNGGWVIDDTYNGNLEGIRAGTALLATLPAKRRIYVTPGLVEQGPESERVHTEMGALIAAAAPDLVVLMKNSVTHHIQVGLDKAGYKGELRLESHPLDFYTNLPHFMAAGDLVLMQNDWTDNYQ